jgi:uncharacterized protein YneF (UPF0154 family)
MLNLIIGLIGLLLGGMYYYSKIHTVNQICDHPELSDDKVRSITNMMRKPFKNKKD